MIRYGLHNLRPKIRGNEFWMDILRYKIMFCDLESLFSIRCNTSGLGRGRSFEYVLVWLLSESLTNVWNRFGSVTVLPKIIMCLLLKFYVQIMEDLRHGRRLVQVREEQRKAYADNIAMPILKWRRRIRIIK